MGSMPKNRNKELRPDDSFAFGPVNFARFGKMIVGRSIADNTKFNKVQETMAAHLPKVTLEINDLVNDIANLVAQHQPKQLMLRAYWEYIEISSKFENNSEHEKLVALRMLDYIQCVISSIQPVSPYKDTISDHDWSTLNNKVDKLFIKLSGEFQICRTAHRKKTDPNFDMNLEELQTRAILIWLNVRGRRYQPHEKQALLDLLSPHTDILEEIFGINIQTMVEELEKILIKLTSGPFDALNKFDTFDKECATRLDLLSESMDFESTEQIRDQLFKDVELQSQRDTLYGELFGFDLFDLQKVTQLPRRLLAELAWSPGEEEDFFHPGEYCGWPFRIWPIMKRPFIRLDDSIYCFEVFSLFDNFYRVFQRLIFRLEPGYRETWNIKQNAISEELTFKYFERLLPGSIIYKTVHYPWMAGKDPSQWPETDGLVVYADHLFVLEVKGGAFTYTSPIDDLQAYIKSLGVLVQNPISQGNRFVDYLETNDEISLFDKHSKEIGRIKKSDFRHITICAITIDTFTDIAARTQHLCKVGINVGNRPAWVLSIDDLRVYTDLFKSPLSFLHFVEQRMHATQTNLVDLHDEMDHLGLYIQNNNYSMYANEIASGNKPGMLQFLGFSSPIDTYYNAITRNEPTRIPKQDIPDNLSKIVNFLDTSTLPFRSEVVSFLLDLSGRARDNFDEGINKFIREAKFCDRPQFGSVNAERAFTFAVWSFDNPRNQFQALLHTMVVIVLQNETTRPLLELEYSEDGQLTNVHWRHVNLDGITKEQYDDLRAAADDMKNRRLTRAKTHGKIPVNSLCPCGSGKKYKKCCRP